MDLISRSARSRSKETLCHMTCKRQRSCLSAASDLDISSVQRGRGQGHAEVLFCKSIPHFIPLIKPRKALVAQKHKLSLSKRKPNFTRTLYNHDSNAGGLSRRKSKHLETTFFIIIIIISTTAHERGRECVLVKDCRDYWTL